MIKHISYSYLHLLACPYAAFLRYQGAIKGPVTPWLALGNALHHALDKAHGTPPFTGSGIGTESNWEPEFNFIDSIRLFKKELLRIIDDDQVSVSWAQVKKLEAEGIQMLEVYNEQIITKEISSKPLSLETPFSIPFEGIDIVGRIDKIERTEDGYIITDFKSGKSEPNEWFLRHNLQLTAYAWACLELYGELPHKVVWHHLRNGKLLESTRTLEDIEDLKLTIHNAIVMHEHGIKHRIFHDKVCGQCDYEGDICDDKELEQEIETKMEEGERMEPRIVLKARKW